MDGGCCGLIISTSTGVGIIAVAIAVGADGKEDGAEDLKGSHCDVYVSDDGGYG